MRKDFLFIMLCVMAVLSVGCGSDQALKKAEKYYALGEYYDAAAQFRKAYSQTPVKEKVRRGQIAAKMAECYRKTNNTSRAITSYNNVIRNKQDDSLTYLRLAQQLMKNGSYKEAAKHFQTAIDSLELRTENAYLTLAKNGLKAAKMAPQWKKEGSAYTVKRMDVFNSRRDDYSPALAGEESDQLFFTSTRNQAQGDEYSGITGSKPADIFWAQKDEKGKWGKPQSIDSELNSDFDEGACCFSPDGKTMYLTQCKTDPQYPRYATIAMSNRSDAAWSKPKEMNISKDTLSSFAHPAVSPDGEWLYFVSDMPGGLGGMDIWRCRLLSGSETGGVENLGAPINTAGDEMFPSFRPNGDLYFSSDGHPGLGGLDIFIAKPKTVGWMVEHPGFPLNSQGDDFGMTFEGLLNQGYFSSSRGDNRGLDHIYSFFNPEIVQTVKGWVYEQDGYELTDAQVYMVGNDGTNLKLSVRGDGSFTQEIKSGVDYVLLGTCKGFLNHQEQLRVEPVTESEEYVLQFPLANIGAPVLIENIFYDFDKATLRPESATALDELVKLLNENPNVTIELSAHTDYKGSDQYNERLSQRRAESVVNYLIEHGIAADRLTPKGYGEGKPKTIKRKVAERYAFLKAGDVLTEDFIAKLPEEQQEQCNQLNRRTEFTVLRTTYGMFDTEGKLIQRPQPKEEPQDSEESQSSEPW
jgi:outer membrane protein OmpA-like peptidoglycan-associated protein